MYISDYFFQFYKINKCNIVDHFVTRVCNNSNDIIEGSVFVAINGYSNNGINFVEDAIANGAKTIIYEDANYIEPSYEDVNFIYVKSAKVELARLLKWYYQYYHKPKIIGITGTNGKTTTSSIVYETLKNVNKKVLWIGTGKVKSYTNQTETTEDSINTTPDIVKLYRYINKNYYDYVIMEVSSQGIAEGRVLGIHFNIVALTNITQDHLDYHKTMDNYAFTKARIAFNLNEDDILIVNNDADYAPLFENSSLAKLKTYNSGLLSNKCTITGKIIDRSYTNMKIAIWKNKECFEVITKLIGNFNLDNILAAYLILDSLDITTDEIIKNLEIFEPVEGRMNYFQLNNANKKINIIVDYAHTPDGIKQVIEYFRSFTNHKILVVVGCGGNRDKDKRHKIGNISTNLADFVYFTEDNSRSEDVNDIILDIVSTINRKNYRIITDRKEAINQAIYDSEKDDVILILGKGAERYIIGKDIICFSDLEYVISLTCKERE